MAGSRHKNHERLNDEQFEGFLNGFIIYSRGPVDAPALLPRTIENFVIALVESGNDDAIEELRGLLPEAQATDAPLS